MRVIDTATAAVLLGCTPRRVQQLVQCGTLTNHGTTRRIRLDVDELSDFAYGMRSCRTAPKATEQPA